MTMTRECEDGIELSWITPKEPNGDILCYNLTMQNGTHHKVVTLNNTNYHTLTGMERGKEYTIIVAAFNGQPGEKANMSYVHNPLPCKGQLQLHVAVSVVTFTHPSVSYTLLLALFQTERPISEATLDLTLYLL